MKLERSSSLGRAAAAAAMVATLAWPVAALQAPVSGQDNAPSLSTEDVLLIPESSSYEYASKRAEARELAALQSVEMKASKGYRRVLTPSGYSFERPESWEAVTNLEASGAPGGFKSDAIFQDAKTGSVLTAMSFDRSAAKSTFDISDKATVDTIVNSMLNPKNDSKATVKIVRRDMGDLPEKKTQWVRVKAEGVSQAQGGGTVAATYWLQMTQTDNLLAVVAVAYPTDQPTAAVPAFHSVRTIEVMNAKSADAAAGQQGKPGDANTAQKAKKDSAGGVRKP